MGGFSRNLNNETQTENFGRELSLFATAGLALCLNGELGSGKSTLARALIRELANDQTLEVPSPTFSLVQPYNDTRMLVHHYDLYRVIDVDEVYELGLFDDMQDRLTIIEWPIRLGTDLPADRIDIHLGENKKGRKVEISGSGKGAFIVARMALVSNFLEKGNWAKAERSFFQGDASSRRYEKLVLPTGETTILMDMPKSPDGPVVRNDKTYSQIAHIAQTIEPVAAINQGLLSHHLSAPKPIQQDLENGLMIIEYLGDQVFGELVKQPEKIKQPLLAATKLLAHFTDLEWPREIQLDSNTTYRVPDFDQEAFLVEAELLVEWFFPLVTGKGVEKNTIKTFRQAWKSVFPFIEKEQDVWTMRDFHTPNLMWLPDRSGHQKVGLIDTQDCVFTHPAYDLVSMLQDARVDLPAGSEEVLLRHYINLRKTQNEAFDPDRFEQAYSILGAQRATKILGIFARLYLRDGKPAYLKHLPRVSNALEKNLAHKSLEPVANWFAQNLPANKRNYKGGA